MAKFYRPAYECDTCRSSMCPGMVQGIDEFGESYYEDCPDCPRCETCRDVCGQGSGPIEIRGKGWVQPYCSAGCLAKDFSGMRGWELLECVVALYIVLDRNPGHREGVELESIAYAALDRAYVEATDAKLEDQMKRSLRRYKGRGEG